jgi:hypothetical protein
MELIQKITKEKFYTMKNKIRILAISLTIGLFIGLNTNSIAQPPPPVNHGSGGNQGAGGAAPIGSGLLVLLGMGAAYGAKKVFNARKRLEE